MVALPSTSRDGPVILITGFDAFGEHEDNPSWELARALHGRRLGRHRLVGAQLPTCFGRSLHRLDELIDAHQPELVLCLGLAATRQALSFERVAINVDDARIADNAGAQPVDTPVIAGAPSAYFSNLPIKAMAWAARDAAVPAEISQTAGTFVCNHVFYGLMHRLATEAALRGVRGGFVHVPPADSSGLNLETMQAGLLAALQAALDTREDLRVAAGALD